MGFLTDSDTYFRKVKLHIVAVRMFGSFIKYVPEMNDKKVLDAYEMTSIWNI